MNKILVIQQYFYPDVSAVSQLLGDLLKEVTVTEINGEYPDITVLCGTTVRNIESVYENDGSLPKNLEKIKIKRLNTNFIFRSAHRIFNFIAFYWGVFWYVLFNRRKFDTVISMTSPPLIGFIVALALGNSKAKFIYYIEDLFPELLFDMGYIKHYWIISKLRMLNSYILKKADRVIVLGSYMLRKLRFNYDFDENNAVIIPNWTTGVEFLYPEKKENGEFEILYSGNLGLSHDFSMIKELLKELKHSDLNVKFSFNGAGRQYGNVKKMFESSDVKYSFAGYMSREDHASRLSKADMYLISQKQETVGDIFPSKFYSYAAAGRPMMLLGTEKSGIGSFIKAKRAGVILEVKEDIPGVIEYIRQLSQNRKEMELTCREIADIYTKEMNFEKSLDIFIKLLSGDSK